MFFFNNSSCCCNRKNQCMRCQCQQVKHECDDRRINCCCNKCCCHKEVQRPVCPKCDCHCCRRMNDNYDNDMDY